MITFISVALCLILAFILVCGFVVLGIVIYEKGATGSFSIGNVSMLVVSTLITIITILVIVFWFVALSRGGIVWQL